MNNLVEGKFGHGAKKISYVRRKARRFFRPKVGRSGIPFDWNTGYDVRDAIGPIAIKNQGTSFSCGGQAGSYWLEIQRRLQAIKEGAISAKSIYAPIAYPGGGTTVVSLETQLGAHGGNLEASIPSYYATGEPLSEAMMIDKSWVNDVTTQDAFIRAGYTPSDVVIDIDEVAEAVRDYGAVIWEIDGQNNGTWLSANPNPPIKVGGDIWTHFMCLVGAKMINGQKTLIALQSWGTNVGLNGEQHFTQNYVDSGYILDCFTLIHDDNVVPIPSNTSIWASLALWFRSQWNLAQSLS